MRAGELREVLTIENPDLVPDVTGGQQAAVSSLWKIVGTVRGRVESISSRERLFSGQLDAGASRKVLIRYNDLVTAQTRFDWRGRKLYVIGSPITDPKRTEMTCLVEERGVAA